MSEDYTPPLEIAAGIVSGKYLISSVYVLTTQIDALTRERDEARAEVERLRKQNAKLRRFAEAVSVHGPDDYGIVWLRIDLSATGGHAYLVMNRPTKNIALHLEAIRLEALGIMTARDAMEDGR